MAINAALYKIPDKPFDEIDLSTFLRVDDALSRLDERARLSPLRAALAPRLLYRNACAAMDAQGCLVRLEDLVLLDGHAFTGCLSPDLSAGLGILKYWQRGLQEAATALLNAPMPGEVPRPLEPDIAGDPMARDRPDYFYDADWDEAGRLERWRRIWRDTNTLPPLIAAAIAWDAWHALVPEQQGPWRSTLLAALALRARGKTRNLLLPLDTGLRLARKRWIVTSPHRVVRVEC